MLKNCPCGYVAAPIIDPWTAAWHEGHRAHHLAAFPAVDQATRNNLDLFVRLATAGIMPRPAIAAGVLQPPVKL